jgi:predicted MFS family arabinose efflux permease
MSQSSISERKLLFLLAAIQFVNVTDFMMVLPLGPDFAAGLNIASNRLGLVAGIYTATAALAGLVGTLFLDKFDRRNALFVAMVGLVAGTVAGGFATGLGTMLMARVVAGAFGGPATALTLSILTDQIAPARRGRAFGIVMGSFSVASVVGVPLGLKLAELGGWRTTFFSVAGMGAVLVPAVIWMMPPMRGHLDGAARRVPARPLRAFFADPSVLLSLLAVAATMLGAFALIANLAAFLQFNLGYPRQHIDKLYAAGGAVAFVTMRIAGRIVDRRGSVLVTIIGTAVTVAVIAATFLPMHPWIPAVGLFIGFMMGNSTRMVAVNTLTMRVPAFNERARFMSAQSAVQHLATAAGTVLAAVILHTNRDQSLNGMATVAVGAIALSLAVPFIVAAIAARLPGPAAVTATAASGVNGVTLPRPAVPAAAAEAPHSST